MWRVEGLVFGVIGNRRFVNGDKLVLKLRVSETEFVLRRRGEVLLFYIS